jgi:predicted nucleotidyltransferase component of viral defense system
MNTLIQNRLKSYNVKNIQEEQNAIKEIAQEIILYALSKTDFFESAFFCGGTALRILHGLRRFSEDLDFSTKNAELDFSFDQYTDEILNTLGDYGLDMTVKKSKEDGFVKAREFKEDSDKWMLSFPSNQMLKKTVIKLEIDARPPLLANCQSHFLHFPILHQVQSGSIETLFAGKLHALLCRPFVKGRDWYDFLWYSNLDAGINFPYLINALLQVGPHRGVPEDQLTKHFIAETLAKKIQSLDWSKASQDVARFLKQDEQNALKLWGPDLFLQSLEKLSDIKD